MQSRLRFEATAICVTAALALSLGWADAQAPRAIAIDPDDIGGTVTSAKGPESGVWVIAETTNLPTKFARIVVTDDQGRYLLPDLPRVSYEVFVRGYGLVDSPRVAANPGHLLDLKALLAPDAKAAARVYPADYWLALLEPPKGHEQEVATALVGCLGCHQLGDEATRTISKTLGTFNSSFQAWDHRVGVGPSGGNMSAGFKRLGESRKVFAEWTDRIAAGALPRQTPPRPTGLERNLVITLWDWAGPTSGRSDAVATNDSQPTVNANGLIYGAIQSDDILATLDPIEHRAGRIVIPSNAPPMGMGPVSPYWGDAQIWKRASDPRSTVMDKQGRVWVATRFRPANEQPSFCKDPSNKFAKYFPMPSGGNRQFSVFDPKTKAFTPFDTCGEGDHNHLSEDGTLFFGQTNLMNWIDVPTFDRTHDVKSSQGWCPAVLDTNADGKITEWTEPDQPVDPRKDHRIEFGCYSIALNPHDGSLWCAGVAPGQKTLVRLERGPNPPQTCKAEVYEPPSGMVQMPPGGGVAVDSNGVVWENWRGSFRVLSFDRRKCRVVNGPTATGQQCPEGWTVYSGSAPTLRGTEFATDMLYLTQTDAKNALGLGNDVVLSGAINSDSFVVVVPRTGQVLQLRVPYPLGFFSRSASGRIDDPTGGWKGRGVWSNFSTYAPWHIEGGKGTLPKLAKFQIRPNPLAK